MALPSFWPILLVVHDGLPHTVLAVQLCRTQTESVLLWRTVLLEYEVNSVPSWNMMQRA
jgi:hypothetical protein